MCLVNTRAEIITKLCYRKCKTTNCVIRVKDSHDVFLRSCPLWSTPEPLLLRASPTVGSFGGGTCPRELQTSSLPVLTPSLGNSCPRKGMEQIPSPTSLSPDLVLQFLLFQLGQAQEPRGIREQDKFRSGVEVCTWEGKKREKRGEKYFFKHHGRVAEKLSRLEKTNKNFYVVCITAL